MVVPEVKVKIGADGSIEFEGPINLYNSSLNALVDQAIRLRGGAANLPSKASPSVDDVKQSKDLDIVAVCEQLNVSSGPDLAMATIAKLVLVDGKRSVTRREILAEISEAHGYVSQSHKSNLGTTLARIVEREMIIKEKDGVFALSHEQQSEYRRKLGI